MEGASGGGLARAREGAHGEEKVAANLTGKSTGGERLRASGAADRGGGGRRRAAVALQGRGRGRVSAEIGGGGGGETFPARNRDSESTAATELGATATMVEGG